MKKAMNLFSVEKVDRQALMAWFWVSWASIHANAFLMRRQGMSDPYHTAAAYRVPLKVQNEGIRPTCIECVDNEAMQPLHSQRESQYLQKLSIILPAYNEAERIEETILHYESFLSNSHVWDTFNQSCPLMEILVVDDGSIDETAAIVRSLASRSGKNLSTAIRCMSLQSNQGKGAAIGRGCIELSQDTSIVLIADSDGSADITSFDAMLLALHSSIHDSKTYHDSKSSNQWTLPAIVVGNRIEPFTHPHRLVLRWGFRIAVCIVCGDLAVRDTQCGFKLMTRTAALQLYPDLHLRRWTHDVELLYRARLLGVSVRQSDVVWRDKPGSKLLQSPQGTVKIILVMLFEIIFMRFQYLRGNWKV